MSLDVSVTPPFLLLSNTPRMNVLQLIHELWA